MPRAPIGRETDSDDWIPLRIYLHYLEAMAAELDEPCLGLRLSCGFQPSDLGPLGLLFINGVTVAEACSRLSTFLEVWQQGTEAEWSPGERMCSWSYRIAAPHLRQAGRQDAFFTLGAMCNWLRLRLGPRWAPVAVHFEAPPPRGQQAVRDFFFAPVLYNQATNALLIDRGDALRRTNQMTSFDVLPFIERQLCELMKTCDLEDDVANPEVSTVLKRP